MDLVQLFALIFGSNAFFTFITFLITRHDTKNDVESKHYAELKQGLEDREKTGASRFDTHAEAINKINKILEQLQKNDSALVKQQEIQTQSLIGLGHDRVVYLGLKYIERGYITDDEYENLHDYLYIPYQLNGGNGTAKKIMDEVDKLPIRPTQHKKGG
jgi:hypothetical protein